MDEFHGEGGTFEIDKASGKRKRVGDAPKSHPDGDRARDQDGKPIAERQPKPQPALPAPQLAPWEQPATAPGPKNPPRGPKEVG